MNRRVALLVAGLSGFLGIALGAFGAHLLKHLLTLNHTIAIWNTAVLYQLVHAPVLLWLAGRKTIPTHPILLFSAGGFLFSGSLYALSLTGLHWLGAITPVGGLLLLAGWVWIAFFGYREESPEN